MEAFTVMKMRQLFTSFSSDDETSPLWFLGSVELWFLFSIVDSFTLRSTHKYFDVSIATYITKTSHLLVKLDAMLCKRQFASIASITALFSKAASRDVPCECASRHRWSIRFTPAAPRIEQLCERASVCVWVCVCDACIVQSADEIGSFFRQETFHSKKNICKTPRSTCNCLFLDVVYVESTVIDQILFWLARTGVRVRIW